ncbi:MAG TPA: 2-phospho-L-lactate transferase [Stellaceae bacterium]|nr:2-phospho-L-lactate transferase [Stellaceae bacterium]
MKDKSGQRKSLGKVVALCGGVGGAKLALGLYRVLPPDDLVLCVNTGDDFEHLGLHVSPDLDTVLYTLAGLNNPETGWGRRDETWTFMRALEALGGETWFRLGDGDLATHLERTRRLRSGESLTAVTRDFARRLRIRADLLPMTDDPVRTLVETPEGVMPFQRYFVARRCEPAVLRLRFDGAEPAQPSPVVIAALRSPELAVVVICPSNPYLSVDPILALPALRTALADCAAPVVAISPLIGGQAVKGPTAKIMAELAVPQTQASIARHYDGLIDGLVIDRTDRQDAAALPVPARITRTLMNSLDDREALAREVLDFGASLGDRATARQV